MREQLSLDGSWKFCPAFVELEANQRFMNPDFDSDSSEAGPDADGAWILPGHDDAGWMDVPVPSSWNKAVPDLWSYEGHGWYRRTVQVPASWAGRRVLFTSDGANYRTVLYVNGRKAGVHEGGYAPFSIAVHDLLNPGETNTIAVSIDNLPKPERCPGGQFDWWNHGGLYRSVRFEVTDLTHIEEAAVVTQPGDGVSRVYVLVSIEVADNDVLVVAAVLRDAAGVEVASASAPAQVVQGKGTAELALEVKDALLWSPDEPNLYGLTLTLREAQGGQARDEYTRRIGIRSIEVKGTQLLLNGEPLIVKGFSRYEDYDDTGRTPNEVALRRDLALVKDMGGNTIRCHCPNSPMTYDLCDEMGVFFISELPLYQWGRPLVGTDSPEALVAAKAQLEEMIRWQRNHPSVLMWSVSNENLCKPRQDTEEYKRLAEMTVAGNRELVDLAHALDSTRPVIEVSNCWPGDKVFEKTDISAVNIYIGAPTPHVSTVGELAVQMHERLEALREEYPDKPILAGEFGSWAVHGLKTDHFPGEAYQAALIKTYWEALEKEPNVIGGLIWCFADSDVHRRFQWVYEYRCAYGVFDLHRSPKEAVDTIRSLWTRGEGR